MDADKYQNKTDVGKWRFFFLLGQSRDVYGNRLIIGKNRVWVHFFLLTHMRIAISVYYMGAACSG